MIGDIGMKHMELLPEMIPSLICFLKDETPAVARQAIITGTYLFRNVLEKVVIQASSTLLIYYMQPHFQIVSVIPSFSTLFMCI